MNWNSVAEFLAMGGYGLYVWGSFGVAALLLIAEMLTLRVRQRALLAPAEPVVPVSAHVVEYQGGQAGHYGDFGAPHEA